ncbi:MAG: endonuclease III [Paludibacteraceae bacterium]|nr:endonuclease III [Paludibacteraceae bacterium]
MTTKERYNQVLDWFIHNAPDAKSELDFSNNFELLVAVVLSAQCTDKRVNMVTPALFKALPDAKSMSQASVNEILEYIHSISYPNSKAQHLHDMAVMLEQDFNGIVPNDPESLQKLPGVGRKTANVIMAVAFDQPAMPVDTHVFRVSNRIGLTNNGKTPIEVEKVLVKNIPAQILSKAHHWLLLHGRYTCTARSPKCEECGISNFCKHYLSNTKQ